MPQPPFPAGRIGAAEVFGAIFSQRGRILYLYPQQLIEQIRPALGEGAGGGLMPSDDDLRQLLEVAYHVSFFTEEDRQVKFRLVYCPQAEVQRILAESTPGAAPFVPLPFARPFSLGEGQVMRLAPATDPSSVTIAIEGDSAGKLCIWGLIDTGAPPWRTARQDPVGRASVPDFLTIASSEPGNLTISRAGQVLARLRRGRLIPSAGNVLRDGPIARYFDDAAADLHAQVVARLPQQQDWTGDGWRTHVRALFEQAIERVVSTIKSLRHGGLLLVVRDQPANRAAPLADNLRIKFPCNSQRVWAELVEGLVLGQKFIELDIEGIYETNRDMHYIKVRAIREQIEDNERRLSDGLRFVAGLTGVDGAVVMTDRFRLLGFGAEVMADAPGLETVRRARDSAGLGSEDVPIEAYGTRHRAAFRFGYSHADSVAFVVSQDGGVKAVKRVGDDLVMWPEINLTSE